MALTGDNPNDYHLSIATSIRQCVGDNQNELWLTTFSAIEAILIYQFFKNAELSIADLHEVEYMTGGGHEISFFLSYSNKEAATKALANFRDVYRQIYDEALRTGHKSN